MHNGLPFCVRRRRGVRKEKRLLKNVGIAIVAAAYIWGMYTMRKLEPHNKAYPIYATAIMAIWVIWWLKAL